jgi:hypothetical protein
MPRRTNSSLSKRRSTGGSSDRRDGSKRPRAATASVDAQVLALREEGNSYSAIARTLELNRATDAHRSFVRALDSQDAAQRERLVDNERVRLDRLEQRIRQRDAAMPSKVERRLLGVDKLREAIKS